jgi:hypothetical protein
MSKEVNSSNDQDTIKCETSNITVPDCDNNTNWDSDSHSNWDSDSHTVVNNWGENGWSSDINTIISNLRESDIAIALGGWDTEVSNLEEGNTTVRNSGESNTKVIISSRNTSINWEESNTTGLEACNYFKIRNVVVKYRKERRYSSERVYELE